MCCAVHVKHYITTGSIFTVGRPITFDRLCGKKQELKRSVWSTDLFTVRSNEVSTA